jgi:hypothetical protein
LLIVATAALAVVTVKTPTAKVNTHSLSTKQCCGDPIPECPPVCGGQAK